MWHKPRLAHNRSLAASCNFDLIVEQVLNYTPGASPVQTSPLCCAVLCSQLGAAADGEFAPCTGTPAGISADLRLAWTAARPADATLKTIYVRSGEEVFAPQRPGQSTSATSSMLFVEVPAISPLQESDPPLATQDFNVEMKVTRSVEHSRWWMRRTADSVSCLPTEIVQARIGRANAMDAEGVQDPSHPYTAGLWYNLSSGLNVQPVSVCAEMTPSDFAADSACNTWKLSHITNGGAAVSLLAVVPGAHACTPHFSFGFARLQDTPPLCERYCVSRP